MMTEDLKREPSRFMRSHSAGAALCVLCGGLGFTPVIAAQTINAQPDRVTPVRGISLPPGRGIPVVSGAVFAGEQQAIVSLKELGQIAILSMNGSVVRRSLPMLPNGIKMIASQLSKSARGVVAFDRGQRAVATLTVGDDRSIQVSAPVLLDLPRTISGLVSCADYMFGYAPDSGGVLYRLGRTGTPDMSISLGPEVYRSTLEEWMDKAELICDREQFQIIVANAMTPQLRAFDFKGRLRWRVEVDGFNPVDFEMTGPSSSRTRIPPGGYHELVAALVDAEGVLIVQYGLITKQSARDGTRYLRIDTRAFDTSTGAPVARPTTLPWLVTSSSDRYLFRTPGGLALVPIALPSQQGRPK